jgi:hypothetical protein
MEKAYTVKQFPDLYIVAQFRSSQYCYDLCLYGCNF